MPNVTLETIHNELEDIKGEIKFIRHVMEEDYRLSDWAKKELVEARKLPDSMLIGHEEAKRRILQK